MYPQVRVGLLRNYGIESLLYEHGVDVSFWGHNHCYERLYPTYDGQVSQIHYKKKLSQKLKMFYL